MKKTNQSGFSAVEGLLIIVIVAILGFTGYYVWHAKQNTDKTLTDTASSQPGIAKAPKVTDFASCKAAPRSTLQKTDPEQCITSKGQKFTEQKYLEIKEWAVKIPLTAANGSAVYSSGHYDIDGGSSPDDAMLGLPSLGSGCGEITDAPSAPLGWYVRFRQDEVSAENVSLVAKGSTSLHELAKTAIEIPGSDGGYGGYYIAYAKPTYDCSKGQSTVAISAASDAFVEALKGIKSGE